MEHRKQVRAQIATCLELVEQLKKASEAGEDMDLNAIVTAMQSAARLQELLSPNMDQIKQAIDNSNQGEALEQADVFNTQPQEVQQLIRPS
jgi:hypothetical protein